MIRPTADPTFAPVIPLHSPKIECPPIAAKHRGRCMPPGCNGAIRVDEEIQRVDGRWLHADCVPHDGVEVWGERQEAA